MPPTERSRTSAFALHVLDPEGFNLTPFLIKESKEPLNKISSLCCDPRNCPGPSAYETEML